jgi:hypothetical protein
MPKRANPHKLAAQKFAKAKSLAAATTGSYTVALVEKSLGNGSFLAQAQLHSGIRQVTILVRGKFRGGKNCPTRVDAGHFVLVEGKDTMIMEVVGVVNRQSELNALKAAKRVSQSLINSSQALTVRNAKVEEEEGGFEFDRSEEKDEDIWAEKDEEREVESELLVRRYRRRAAGASRAKKELGDDDETEEIVLDDVEEVEEAVEETPAEAADMSEEAVARRQITSKRRLAAIAKREAEEAAAAAVPAMDVWADAEPEFDEEAWEQDNAKRGEESWDAFIDAI